MAKENGNNKQMRERIAHLAARLMAVDGIDDYALAKRKAARQAGASETRNLPNNDEVEHALRAYQQLYQADEQPARLRHLRTSARKMMEWLARFNPYLVGTVLSGRAGKYSEIELLLFTDSMKEVELFLLNRGIVYRCGERPMHIGDEPRSVANFSISTEDADFDIAVLEPHDLRSQIRLAAGGRPLERVRAEWLDAQLANPDALDA